MSERVNFPKRPMRRLYHGAHMALANLRQRRLRLLVAIAGAAVPILLLLLQLALLQAVRIEVTRLYNDFKFDIAIVPTTYQFLFESGAFDRVRLAQARTDPRVAGAFSLNIESAAWTDKRTQRRSPVILIGLDTDPAFIADPDIRAGLDALRRGRLALADAYSNRSLGSVEVGTDGLVNDRNVTVAGQFRLGLFFYADGAVIVNGANIPLLTGNDSRQTSIGLLQVVPGADPRAVRDDLAVALPPDVQVLLRRQLLSGEAAFFLSTKPLGIMVLVGMFVAAIAGTVALWQVLSAQIRRRIHEYATLRAMGFSPRFVLSVGALEILFLGLLAYLPALAAGAVILAALEWSTHLPTGLSIATALQVLAIVLGMCGFCAASVLRRIWKAQPADLF